jgi:protein TonB
VDTAGWADITTLRILQSDHPLFADAIRNALRRLRFTPAELRGVRVRQLVQQPFRFGLDRE